MTVHLTLERETEDGDAVLVPVVVAGDWTPPEGDGWNSPASCGYWDITAEHAVTGETIYLTRAEEAEAADALDTGCDGGCADDPDDGGGDDDRAAHEWAATRHREPSR